MTISDKTKITLSFTILGTLISVAFYLGAAMEKLDNRLEQIDSNLSNVTNVFLKTEDFIEYSHEERDLNPSFHAPDVRSILHGHSGEQRYSAESSVEPKQKD